ncbi:hypothetical protein [uncultured Campylobacter sp.]|uniref:hypothetical protein n=1 Tax=uncultured Campylobacter sp. TaxID=218934 RepID=UPI002605BA87|nr:hypothetical protein [uncultured Campylobacter sp.]
MKKANLACAPLPVARILGKFGGINLTRLQAKFDENLKFESKFCGADGFLKPNPNLLKFDKATSKFNQSANKKRAKSSQNKASYFSAYSRATLSNFKLQNPKERKNK